MAKINVLDKNVAELIAAGEVVERPASAIKEMVENSIDAGATVITVEIRDGGVTYMRVQDNGCGIAREDVPNAFLRHATSKVKVQDDLDAIQTLGFRGEALASICAMARVEMLTRTAEELAGTRYVIEGGETVCCEDAGCPQGTTIVVRDLFFNTPARMKFLKKDVAEGNAVAVALDKAALSHPEISFRLIRDGKETLRTAGDGNLKTTVTAVFGREFSAGMIPVDYKLGSIHVTGLISRPADARPKRGMQNFFINGRYIKSTIASAALEQACKGVVMVGKFPSCVLHISVPAEAVDVNVHPAKTEVRFITERPIFDAVYRAAVEALSAKIPPAELKFRNETTISPEPEQTRTYTQLQFAPSGNSAKPIRTPDAESARVPAGTAREFVEQLIHSPEMPEKKPAPIQLPDDDDEYEIEQPVLKKPEAPINPFIPMKPAETPKLTLPVETPMATEPKPTKLPAQPVDLPEDPETLELPVGIREEMPEAEPLKFLGEAFQTYILLETHDELIYIDKHAAHERILYERLKRDSGKRYAQQLLCPLAITLDREEYSVLLENSERLENAGFELSDFGSGTLIVRSVPLSFGEEDVKESLIEIAAYLLEHRSDLATQHDDWLYHNIACRAAIKSGDRNDPKELLALAQQLHDHPEIRYCPHGRPIYLAVSRRELERQFGRV